MRDRPGRDADAHRRDRARGQDNVERPRTDEAAKSAEGREQPVIEPQVEETPKPVAEAPDTTTPKTAHDDPTKLDISGDESKRSRGGSGTPASSNMTRPGLTTATQCSGEPLPEPMRVSAGFFVYALSGKTLIQTLPPRLILRVIAIRAASIWRFVIQPASSALRP